MRRIRRWLLFAARISIVVLTALFAAIRFTSLHTTLLLLAAESGNEFCSRLMISCGGDVNGREADKQRTPLMLAALQPKLPVIQLLIAAGSDVNARDKDGYTPIMCAGEQSNVGMVKLLVNAGADVNAKASFGGTALMSAAYWGNPEVVSALLEAGADPSARTADGNTALCAALESGQAGSVACDEILIKVGCLKGLAVPFGRIQHSVTAVGHTRALLAHGVDPNEQGQDGTTALMIFAYDGNVDCSKLLLDHGANINAVAKNGHTPLTEAVAQGCDLEVDFLLRNGADAGQKRDGQDLLTLARHRLEEIKKWRATAAIPSRSDVVRLLEEHQARSPQ